jgi:hypothetical protein
MERTSSVPEEFVLLMEQLTGVMDRRFARGKIHPMVNVLGQTILVLMAGRSMSDISRYGKAHPEVLSPLGLRGSPSVATLSRVHTGPANHHRSRRFRRTSIGRNRYVFCRAHR